MTDVGGRIRYMRRLRELTQEELAKKVGLSHVAIAHYERGDVENLKRSVAEKLGQALECSPAYLLGWSDSISGDNQVETNNGVVDQNNIIVNTTLSKEEEELLRIYQALDVRARISLLQTAMRLEEKQ